jgi:uncharacterized protein (DUF58 family)
MSPNPDPSPGRNRRLRQSTTTPVPTGPDAAATLRRLELAVTGRLDGLLQGDHLGLVPGHGTEPGETRRYSAGDDVRRIDWNVTARSSEVHIRETIADRELETWVLADLSPSMDFGTAECTKRDLGVAAAAAAGFLTARTGNRIGSVILGSDGPTTFPARGGRRHLQALLHHLVTRPTNQDPSYDAGRSGVGVAADQLADGLDRVARLARRRGLVVVVSDFLAPAGWQRPLRWLATRHDVLAVEVLDPRELELPAVGMLELVDPETGRRLEVPTNDAGLRARYAGAAEAQRAEIAATLRAAPASHLQLRTDRDWLGDLVRFVHLRRRRRSGLSTPATGVPPTGVSTATTPGGGR